MFMDKSARTIKVVFMFCFFVECSPIRIRQHDLVWQIPMDPGSPSARYWNLNIVRFGSDLRPQSLSQNITGCLGNINKIQLDWSHQQDETTPTKTTRISWFLRKVVVSFRAIGFWRSAKHDASKDCGYDIPGGKKLCNPREIPWN